jgi:FAD/FMN-containing dehydrogenase
MLGETLRAAGDPMTTTEVQPHDVAAFAATLSGTVIRPDDEGYAAARRVWNGSIDRYPSLIVRPRTSEDVALTIALAREHRLPLAVRGGGHNVAGSGTCDTGVVLDLVEMNDVVVDSGLGTIRAGGGCTWAQVDSAAAASGLATPGGLISSTGVAGLTLGGGIGWLSRQHGYTCDNLLEVELVTADGAIEHVSAEVHADLFWALRGGGGNFGVVTAFTFRGHPVSTVLGGPMLFRADRAAVVLEAYASWAPTVPDEMATMVAFVTAPPAPFVPDDLQGRPALAVLLCHAGDLDQGRAVVDTLRQACPPDADANGPMPYPVLQQLQDAGAPHGIRSYWKSGYLAALTADVRELLADAASAAPTPQSQIHVQQLGAAMARGTEGAVGHRDAAYVVNILGNTMDPREEEAATSWVRETWQRLQPHCSGAYVNFLDGDDGARVESAFSPEAWRRLQVVKRQWDPDNVFRLNHNIPPAPE